MFLLCVGVKSWVAEVSLVAVFTFMVSAISVVLAASSPALQGVILHVIARCSLLSVVEVGLTVLLLTHHLVILWQWLAGVLHLTLLSELLQIRYLT